MTSIAVYTCITRDYDVLTSPTIHDDRIAYYCFTDDPATVVPPWTCVPIALRQLSAKDQNRHVKMHPHKYLPQHDITIYVDGSVRIIGDVYALVESLASRSEDIFLYRHPIRSCVYLEAAACSHYAHDWLWNIAAQMRRYQGQGYPINNGLYEAGVIIRRQTQAVASLMDVWWKEYQCGVKRDQVSLPYAAWRLGMSLGRLGNSDLRAEKKYFLMVSRKRRRSIRTMACRCVNRSVARIVPYQYLFGIQSPLHWAPP